MKKARYYGKREETSRGAKASCGIEGNNPSRRNPTAPKKKRTGTKLAPGARSLARSSPKRAKDFSKSSPTTPSLNVATRPAKGRKRMEGKRERERSGLRPRKRSRAQPTERKRKEGNEKWPIDVKSHGEALLNVLAIFMRPTLPAAP